MTPSALLDELKARGAVLTVSGGRIRVQAPAAAVTPELRAALAAHKPDLLRLLAKPVSPPPPKAAFRFVDGLMDWGDICAGWTPGDWAIELRRKADRCDRYRPEIAEYFRGWAADIEARLNQSSEPS